MSRNSAGCEGKVRFATWALANDAASRRRDQRREAYHCQFCNGFHVGTKLARLRKPRPKIKERD